MPTKITTLTAPTYRIEVAPAPRWARLWGEVTLRRARSWARRLARVTQANRVRVIRSCDDAVVFELWRGAEGWMEVQDGSRAYHPDT